MAFSEKNKKFWEHSKIQMCPVICDKREIHEKRTFEKLGDTEKFVQNGKFTKNGTFEKIGSTRELVKNGDFRKIRTFKKSRGAWKSQKKVRFCILMYKRYLLRQ